MRRAICSALSPGCKAWRPSPARPFTAAGAKPCTHKSRISGAFPPPSPPAEKATSSKDQTGQASTSDGAGDGTGWCDSSKYCVVDTSECNGVCFECRDYTPPNAPSCPHREVYVATRRVVEWYECCVRSK